MSETINREHKDRLVEHQSEVRNMCLTEYDEAETMQMFKEEGREEGIQEGLQKGRNEGIRLFVLDKLEDAIPESKIVEKLQKLYQMSEQDAIAYVDKCIRNKGNQT